ncbi:MAG: phage holin, partial [Acutalibacteraceae bacterium]
RFKSKALWLSLAALIIFCAKEFCGIDLSAEINGLLNVLLPVLVAFGVINNPTNQNGI